MASLIITYDPTTGTIADWRYEPHDDYQPDADELALDPGDVDHRDLDRQQVDTDTGTLEPIPNYVEPEALDRAKVSDTSKQTFRDSHQAALDAKDAGNVQVQLDAHRAMLEDVYRILTGAEL
ncbi:hypothetical protein [Haladaptatus sp. DYF46]|uniref:hypothetical protein n=1 Tax=Haladaptatus sp. DYF46 TaxID=2886041 RepID=UPI001E47E426|nr:hypothetical protein [Haladaptatus sp. DYF46]